MKLIPKAKLIQEFKKIYKKIPTDNELKQFKFWWKDFKVFKNELGIKNNEKKEKSWW